MKLTNIFKNASPFINNIVTLLVVGFLFVQENQTKIEEIFNHGEVGSVRFQNIFAVIVFVAGILKAFSSNTGTAKTLKTVLLPPLITLLTYLTREPEPPVEKITPITDAPVIENPTQ